jgi:hypothetical protein
MLLFVISRVLKQIQEHCVIQVSRADLKHLFDSQNWKKKNVFWALMALNWT